MTDTYFNRWDVVKVPYPFTEGVGEKRRPALVINGDALAREHGFYWLVMITSAIDSGWVGDVPIKNLATAGLNVASVVRTAKIMTVQQDRILGRLGRLAAAEARQVEKALIKWLNA